MRYNRDNAKPRVLDGAKSRSAPANEHKNSGVGKQKKPLPESKASISALAFAARLASINKKFALAVMLKPNETGYSVYDDSVVRKVLFLHNRVTLPTRTEAEALHALRRSKRAQLVSWEEKKQRQAGNVVEGGGDDVVLSEAAARRGCPGFGDLRQSEDSRRGREVDHSNTPRIAFLFLVRGPIATEPVWRAFFGVPKGQPDGCPAPKIRDPRVSVHVHSSPFFEPPESSIFARHTLTNRTLVSWGSFAVVDAMVLLLRASLRDSQNKHFAFFSEKCVPLHSLPCTHAFFSSAERSFVAAWKTDERRYMYNFTVDRTRLTAEHPRGDRRRLSERRRGDEHDGEVNGGADGRKAKRRTAWPPSTVDYGSHWRKGHMWVVLHRRDAVLVAHPLVVGEWVAAHVLGNGSVASRVNPMTLARLGSEQLYYGTDSLSIDSTVYRGAITEKRTTATNAGGTSDGAGATGGGAGQATSEGFEDSDSARMDHWLHRPIADEHYIHTVLAAHGREWNTMQGDDGCWLGGGGDDGGGVNCDHDTSGSSKVASNNISSSSSSSSSRRRRRRGRGGGGSGIAGTAAFPYSLHLVHMVGWHAAEMAPKAMSTRQGATMLRKLRGTCEFRSGASAPDRLSEVSRTFLTENGPPYPHGRDNGKSNSESTRREREDGDDIDLSDIWATTEETTMSPGGAENKEGEGEEEEGAIVASGLVEDAFLRRSRSGSARKLLSAGAGAVTTQPRRKVKTKLAVEKGEKSKKKGWEAHKGEYGGGDSCSVTLKPSQQPQERGQAGESRHTAPAVARHLCYLFMRKVPEAAVAGYLTQSPHLRVNLSQ